MARFVFESYLSFKRWEATSRYASRVNGYEKNKMPELFQQIVLDR